jgi:hypothetical protein
MCLSWLVCSYKGQLQKPKCVIMKQREGKIRWNERNMYLIMSNWQYSTID